MSEKRNNKKLLGVLAVLFVVLSIASAIIMPVVSVPNAVKTVFISIIVLGLITLIVGFVWSKRNPTEKKVKRGILLSLLSLGVVIVMVFNGAVDYFNVAINQYLTKPQIDDEALEQVTNDSRELVERIEDEGIVLLENKENALPLDTSDEREKNVNVFGQASVQIVYGGSGSGAGDEEQNISLQQGLENAGFTVNKELTDIYEENKPEKEETDIFSLDGGDYTLSQPPEEAFTDEVKADAETFSDVALIVLSRSGGEGGDLPFETGEFGGSDDRHYLEVSEAEEDMIDMVTSMDFEKVVVVINSSNAMELGFLDNPGIDGAIVIGGPGATGNNSVGKVLAGDVNPSGRLVNIYAYDVTTSPAFYNAGDFKYSNTEHEGADDEPDTHTFLNYNEGIYVGYRYYETRYVDNETGEMDEEAYREAVQYPFGYGLSYTDFSQEIVDYQESNDLITVDIEVTNNGTQPGKEVVQLYYTPPYEIGGIEKSHVNLAAFDKTSMLEPGESETITLELAVEDMASYDAETEQAYVLDQGTYGIKLMNNSHDVIDQREYELSNKIVYNEENKRDSDFVVATNQFDDTKGDLTYVSRADWEGTLPTERTADKEATEEIIAAMEDLSVEDNPDDEPIVFAKNDLTLEDVVGLDYDDPKWGELLEQLSIEDMTLLIGYGGYGTQAIESIGKPATEELDGPAGINGIFSGVNGVQYVSEVVVASTWNMELAEQMGEYLANEALVYHITGIYGPAMNIHRTPFSGRNFEYYSEDPFISGKIGAAVVKGTNDQGVYTFIKHYALNDQETNRLGVATWANEQSIREIYLKAFELPVKEGGTTAMMSSFNRFGTKWAGAHEGLLKDVLRDEWGFRGVVITDFDGYEYMVPDQAIRGGTDLMLTPMGDEPTAKSKDTNTGQQAMREASHNILYTIANSKALEVNEKPYPWWIVLLSMADLLLLALLTLGFRKIATGKRRKTAN
ncbi:glycoside hydrolase family 3 N-terminal domain-containing protein [Gracilibacillus sp. S3-1-1]|uniref:Glycoside hydrolase family 3 N-terminal domain-containing protein n=1 Tax=Gracilibacillus pellucidus TaxID=3095368 RepID=A0ACC6M307_9BACI|nr:glycoside hydrolase family 3 N-terminal domain-containing protein [Gracilibacillus sp. S3-1-1]MDX8045278.1 glycoside hydrolase family 3 N-terminal domain-containing protein [Gracilibacillus sp. S3-1-1]